MHRELWKWLESQDARSTYTMFSKCGPLTSGISITWKMVRNPNSQARASTYPVRNSAICILTRPLGDSGALICIVKRKEREEAEGSCVSKKSEFFDQLLDLS